MNKSREIDVFKLIDNLLIQAGVSKEDFARHTGLYINNIPTQRLLNDDQAIVYLGNISKPTFYRLIKAGAIKQVHISEKLRRYDFADLDDFIEQQKSKTIEAFT